MIDISSAKIEKMIIHHVGSKIREEGYNLSPQEAASSELLNDLLLRHYLLPLTRSIEIFDFFHESDITLNEVYKFTSQIFRQEDRFSEQTQNIAKHLYSVSSHPNIVGGEVIILLVSDIRYNKEPMQGLAILKIEGKDSYLDIKDEFGTLQLIEKTGIPLNKIQKGALILSQENIVHAIDTLGQKTKYWLESFLKVKPKKTKESCAKIGGTILKALSSKIGDPADSLELNKRLEESLDSISTISLGEIKKISREYLDNEKISGILSGAKDKAGFELPDELEIETNELKKYTKKIVNRTKIDEGISLIVTNPKARVHDLSIKKTTEGFQAIIDITLEEKI